jgi:hypothetical protein
VAGTVTFYNGGAQIGTITLSKNAAVLTLGTLPVDTDVITAVYGGDTKNAASTSSALSQTVNSAVTTTLLSSSNNPASITENVTFTAKVTGQFGVAPTGTVTFYDGKNELGTSDLTNGVASLTTNSLSVHKHTITAVFAANLNFASSTSSALSQVVDKVSRTTTTLSSSANPSQAGEAVTFTATVTAASGAIPDSSVTFQDGSTVLGTVNLTNGVAKFTTSGLAAGQHTIEAIYYGDFGFKQSSAKMAQTVQ